MRSHTYHAKAEFKIRVMDIFVRAVIDTFFGVDISEVNYASCRYFIDNIQTHFPFLITYKLIVCGEKTVES